MGSHWCRRTASPSHHNTCSGHFPITVYECRHGGFIPTYLGCVHAWLQIHQLYSSMSWMSLHDNGHSTLTANVSNHQSQDTTAKRKTERKKPGEEKCQLSQRDHVKPQVLSSTTATGSSSFLTAQAEPQRPPTALSGPFCLHAQSSEQQGRWQVKVKWCACWPAICERGGWVGGSYRGQM